MNITSYSTPCGSEYQEAYNKTFQTLKHDQQLNVRLATLAAVFFAGPLFFLVICAAFTKSVQYYDSCNKELDSKISELIKKKFLKLPIYGISEPDYKAICSWYVRNQKRLINNGINKLYTKSKTGLNGTVIYIANGPNKGLHIPVKITQNDGSENKTIRTLHVDR